VNENKSLGVTGIKSHKETDETRELHVYRPTGDFCSIQQYLEIVL